MISILSCVTMVRLVRVKLESMFVKIGAQV